MALIKRKDIIEQGDPLKELKKSLIEAQKYVDKLTGSNKQLAQALQLIKKTNDGTEAKKLIENTKKLTTETNNLTAAQKQILKIQKQLIVSESAENKQLSELKVKQSELNKQTKQAARDKLGLISVYEKESRKLTDLRKRYKDLAIQNKQNTKEGRALLANITKLDKKLKSVDNAVGQNQRSVGKYGNALKGLGQNLIGSLGVVGGMMAFVSVLKGAFKIFTQFSKASSKLAAILGKSKSEIKGLTEQAKLLGSTTAYTAGEILGLQTELAKLGFSLREIEASTPGILDLAAATGQDLAQSAELAGATLRIFNLDASEMQRVTDVLAKSTTISSLSMEKLATILPTVGKTAQIAGVSLEKTAALAGTLTDRGLDASSAATSLRNIFLELSKKGITWQEAMEKINNSTDKNKTSMDLFGKRAAAAGVILSETGASVDKLTTSLNDSNGAAKRMADTMLDNLAGDITKASSAWEGFILSLEDGNGVISRVMRSSTKWVTRLLTELKELNSNEITGLANYKERSKFQEILNKKNKEFNSLIDIQAKKTNKLTNELATMRRQRKPQELIDAKIKELELAKKEDFSFQQLILKQNKLAELNVNLVKHNKKVEDFKKRDNFSEKTALLSAVFKRDLILEQIKHIEKFNTYSEKKNEILEENTEDLNANTKAINKNKDAKNEQTRGEAGLTSDICQISGITPIDTSVFQIKKKGETLHEKLRLNKEYYDKIDADAKQSATNRAEFELIKQRQLDSQKLELAAQAQDAVGQLVSDIFAVQQDEKLAKSQSDAEAEKAILQDRLDKGLISEAEYKKRIEIIDKKGRLEAAKAAKKKALFDIGIQTLVNVVKVAAAPWLIPGVIAAGLIQAAAVAATPLPQLEDGKIDLKGKRHSEGGIDVNVEGGESVIARLGTANAPNILNMVNDGLLKDSDLNLGNNYNLATLELNGLLSEFKNNTDLIKETNKILSKSVNIYENGNFINFVDVNGILIKQITKR